MPTDLIDSHAHLNMLTWTDLESMRLAGVGEVVSPIMLDAAKAVSSDTIADMWDYLLDVQLDRAKGHLLKGHGMVCLNMASTPREDPARLLGRLPEYLERPEIVAIGEIGFEPQSRTCQDLRVQETLLMQQLRIAKDAGVLVVIHTPHPPDSKRLFAERTLELCARCNLPMAQVAIDHCSEANIRMALDAGAYAGISVQPWRGMTPDMATDLVRDHGSERIMLDSDCSSQHSDPLAVPKTALALQRKGVSEKNIEKVCGENARRFYRI